MRGPCLLPGSNGTESSLLHYSPTKAGSTRRWGRMIRSQEGPLIINPQNQQRHHPHSGQAEGKSAANVESRLTRAESRSGFTDVTIFPQSEESKGPLTGR